MSTLRLSHIGICVRDLARARHFYCAGLGFRERGALAVSGEEAATLLELPGVALEAVYLERDGVVIELLHFARPGTEGPAEPRAMNQLGLTHLSLRVDDLAAALAAAESAGGRPLPHTRTFSERFRAGAVFLTDPDGTRIELVQSPTPMDKLPGEP